MARSNTFFSAGDEALLVVLLMVCAFAAPAAAAEPKTELLWPGGAPGAKGDRDPDKPAITVHLPAPEKANGTAVVICPGGGYGALMMSYEGHDIAQVAQPVRHRRHCAQVPHQPIPAPRASAGRPARHAHRQGQGQGMEH